jgi:hypothetical protein
MCFVAVNYYIQPTQRQNIMIVFHVGSVESLNYVAEKLVK